MMYAGAVEADTRAVPVGMWLSSEQKACEEAETSSAALGLVKMQGLAQLRGGIKVACRLGARVRPGRGMWLSLGVRNIVVCRFRLGMSKHWLRFGVRVSYISG